MSKVYNFNEWKLNEQDASQPTTDSPAEQVKFNAVVGGNKILYLLTINVDKETKKRYPGTIQILAGGKNFIVHRKEGSYSWPKNMPEFFEAMGNLNPKENDEMSAVGAWKKFVAKASESGVEVKATGDFAKYMNGEWVNNNQITTAYSKADPFFEVPAKDYTFNVRNINIIDADTKKKTGAKLGRQIMVEKDGKKASYLIKTIYGKSYPVLDKEGTAESLRPKNTEEIAKLEKVMDKNSMMDKSLWTELGAGIKAKVNA